MTYKAYSGERLQSSDLVLIMPRPTNAQYLAATAKAIKDAGESRSQRDLPLLKLDSLKAFSTYWNFVPTSERHYPTEDAKFDERYTAWLRQNSVWVPLKTLLKSKPEELIEAGYPEREVRAFLDAYHELEQAESSSPGKVSQEVAAKFLAASRSLGEAVNLTKYPTVAMIDRETHFNAMNPFWLAPYAYGTRDGATGHQPGIRHGDREEIVHGADWLDDLPSWSDWAWDWGSRWRSMDFTSACESRAGRRSPTCMRRSFGSPWWRRSCHSSSR